MTAENNGSVRLDWPGKSTKLEPVGSPPTLITTETIGWPEASAHCNRLIHGDNLEAMRALSAETAPGIDLIYIDPPFFTGRDWHTAPNRALTSEPAYSDTWNHDLSQYLQWLYDRLVMAHGLLAPTGSIYLHLNWQAVHYAKLLLDEIFGIENFQNEVIWCYREAINSRKRWNRKHDTILYYSRTATFTFNPDAVLQPYSNSTLSKYKYCDDKGPYRIMGRGITNSPLRSKRDIAPQMEIDFPDLTYRHYLGQGTLPVDYFQIDIENQASSKRTGYPTQKPEALLERLLLASSNEGDLIADFCCGSGTTLAVAQRLGRRWIGCDSGEQAISTCKTRLLSSDDPFLVQKVESLN